jgi:hypothetical protein
MKDILELQLSEIGIIRASFRQARKQGNIDSETENACERFIEKMQMLNEVFNFTNRELRYIWREEEK